MFVETVVTDELRIAFDVRTTGVETFHRAQIALAHLLLDQRLLFLEQASHAEKLHYIIQPPLITAELAQQDRVDALVVGISTDRLDRRRQHGIVGDQAFFNVLGNRLGLSDLVLRVAMQLSG
ncbi:hypothetical protein D3C81_1881800 [compost metagenome]